MKNNLEDLSVAARRGALSATDAQELERLLDDAADERLWHDAGLGFDAEEARGAEDHAASARVLQRLLASPARPAKSPRFRPVVLLSAAAVLAASAAAAVVAVEQYRKAAALRLEAAETRTPPPPTAALLPSPPTVVEAPSAAVPLGPSPALTPNAPKLDERSAAELLSAAGQARRQGQSARAITLLETLKSRYPASAEALASDITLGMLRLEHGSAATALTDFDRYLRRAPRGNRAADALWGRAQALAALHRPAEAKVALQALLAGYPTSPYGSAARAKLRAAPP